MSNAVKDNNGVAVAIGMSNADGSTPKPIQVNPTTHILQTDDDTGGSDLSTDSNAGRDDNARTILMGVSSDDGETPVEVYIDDSTGKLLINSN